MSSRLPANRRLMRDPLARRRARAVFRRRPLAQALTAAWLLPVLVLAIAHCPAWALPTGAELAAGQATVRQSDALTMQVHQTSNKAVLNWQSFGVERNETVQFLQPSTSAITLNRVLGRDPSAIFGRLNANGQVFLINPNGVVFGANARVDVGGIVASTLGLSNNDFLAGRYAFSADGSTASVSNAGALRAADGGYVVLLGNQVVNTGTLAAPRGSVALGAGERISLDFHGDGLLSLAVDAAAVKALVSNAGLIDAAGGAVTLSARARNALLDTVLNVEGTVRATSLVERNGAIFLDGGESGVTRVSGTLDASGAGPGLTGGRVTVLGEKIGLFDGAALDASGAAGGGRVLVGGNWQGMGPERNAQMTHVAAGVRIDASATGNGHGGTAVVWSDDTTRFFGAADARGGAASGDGGFVEVSGKSYLDFRGSSDRSAPRGQAGMLLLDPTNLTIDNTANSNVTDFPPPPPPPAPFTFMPVPGAGMSSTLNWTTLLTALDSGDVTVTTAGSFETSGNRGDITIAASPSGVYSRANTLTLTTAATGAIIVNAPVSNTRTGALNLIAGTGGVQFNAGITLAGGNLGITSSGEVTQSPTGDLRVGGTTSIMAGANAITLANLGNNFTGAVTLNSTGASVSIRGTNALTLAAPTLGANTALTAIAGTTLTLPAAAISAGTGAIDLQSQGGNLTTAASLSGGTVNLFGSAGLNLGHDVTAGGTLTFGSTNSAINQTAGALAVTGVTTVNAGTGDITLAQAGNDFTGAVALNSTGASVSVRATNALNLTAPALGPNTALTAIAGTTLTLPAAAISTGAGAIDLQSQGGILTTAASLSGGTVNLFGSSGLNLGHDVTAGGTLTLGSTNSAINQTAGALAATGATTVNAGTGDITLAQAGNDFTGAVALNSTGASVSVRDTNALTLAAPTLGANTALTAISGTTLTLPAAAIITGTGAIDLQSQGGSLTTAAALSGGTVNLFGSAGLNLGHDVTAGGTLTLGSTNSAINQTAGALAATGATTVNAGTGDITLAQAGNDFTGAVTLNSTGTSVNIRATNALNLTAPALGPNTALTAIAGTTLTLPAAAINTGTGAIDLQSQGGSLTTAAALTGGTVNLFGSAGLNPGHDVTAGGTLTLGSTNSAINQTAGALTATGATTVNAGTGDITLAQAGNDFIGAVTLNSTGTSMSVRDTNALILAAPLLGANTALTAIAGTTLTLPAAPIITGTGAIDLRSQGGSLTTAASLSGGTVNLFGSGGLNLSHDVTAGGTLTLGSTNSAINQTAGVLTVTGVTTANAGTGVITLAQSGNDFTGAVSAAGANITLKDATAIVLGNVTASGTLNVDALGGSLTQSAAPDRVLVTGTSALAATTGILLANAGNDFQAAVTLSNAGAGASVNIRDANALTLAAPTLGFDTGLTAVAGTALTLPAAAINTGTGGIDLQSLGSNFTTSGALSGGTVNLFGSSGLSLGHNLTAGGTLTLGSTNSAINQTAGALTATGATTVNAGSGVITLAQAGNDFTGAVSAAGFNITLKDASAIVLGNVTASGTLNVDALGGSLTQSAAPDRVQATLASALAATTGILLANVGNDFQGVVALNNTGAGSSVSIRDTNALTLAAPALGANTALTAIAGTALTLPAAAINTGAGAIDLRSLGGSLSTGGALTGGAVNLVGSGGLNLGHHITASAALTLGSTNSPINQTAGALTVTGVTTANAGSGPIALAQAANNFQAAVSATGANINLKDANALVLGDVTATGTLNVEALGGSITQTTAPDRVLVTGLSSLTATHTISVDNAGNNFQGAVSVSSTGTTVSIRDTDALTLGALTLGANTALTAIAGTTLTLPAAAINTGTGGIDLRSLGGSFATSGALSGGTVNLFSSSGLNLGHSITAGGALTLGSTNSAISQTAGALTVTGTTTVNAGTGAITLARAGNDFQAAVTLTGGATQVTDSNALTLGTLSTGALTVVGTGALNLGQGTVSGVLSATSNNGALTQAGPLTVTAATTVNAGIGNITLNNAGNDFQAPVTLTGAVTQIRDVNALTLGTLATTNLSASSAGPMNLGQGTVTGTLTATANNSAVTQAGPLTVTAPATVNAGTGSITLNNASNDFRSTVALTGGATQLTDSNALTLGAINVGNLSAVSAGALNLGQGTVTGTLSVNSNNGGVTQTGPLTVTAATTALAVAGNIMLTDPGNDFQAAVTLGSTGAAVSIRDANALALAAPVLGVNSALTATAGTTLTLLPAGINAGTGAISLQSLAGSLTTAGPLIGGTVNLFGSSGLVLNGNLTASAALTLSTTNSAITQSAGALSAAGTTTVNAGTGAISLAQAGNNFTGAVNAAGASVSLKDANAIVLGSVTATGALNVDALGGSITQTSAPDRLVVTGASTLAATADISLANAGNDFQAAVTLRSTGGGASVSVRDANALTLAAPTLGANTGLTAIAGTTLTLPAATIDSGTGSIDLRSVAGSLTTAGALIGGAVSLAGSSGLNLNGNVTAGGALTLGSTNSAVSQTAGALTVAGVTTVNAGTGAITLTQAGNDFGLAVALNGGVTQLTDRNALTLGLLDTGSLTVHSTGALNLGQGTVAGALSARSDNGAVTQTGALRVSAATRVDAGDAPITLTQANSFAGGVALFNSGSNNAAVTADALALGASTLGGALTAVATVGSITQTGVITTGASGSSFSTTTVGRAIDLATQVNRFGSHSVGFNTTGAADVAVKAETLNFAASNVGGKLSATTTVGGITQVGAIAAGSLELATANAEVSLGSPTNAVSSLRAATLGTGALSLVNGGTLTVNAPVAASGGITLKSTTGHVVLKENLDAGAAGVALSAPSGAILQDAGRVISAGALGVEALAAPMLVTVGPLRTISANITGANNPFSFTQAGTFNVGSVEGASARISGVKTNGGAISLTATTGSLTMSQPVDAGAGVVNLSAAQGSITQSVTPGGGGAVKGVLLTASSATGQALTGPNTVGGFRASNSSSGDIALSNTAASLTITGIANAAANGNVVVTNTGNTAVSGAVRTAGSGLIALATTGSLALGSDLDAGAGSVALTSSNGTITQTLGRTITATELGVQANAAPALATSGSLATIAARITGAGNPFAFTQAGTFAVGAVGPISGVSTQGGAITLGATSGDLTMSRAVDAGAAAVTLSATQGSISQTGAGAVRSAVLSTQSRSGQLLGGANAVGSFSAANSSSGDVALNHTGAPLLVTGITNAALNGKVTVTNTGATTIGGPVRTAGAGLITLISPAGLSLNGLLDAGSGVVVLSASNGAITQAAGGTITAGSLGVEAVAAPSLSASGTLRTVAAHITGPGNAFAFEQAGTFDVGSVQGTGATIDGVKTRGGTVSLTASVGELTMSQPVDAGAAAVSLSAAQGSIRQTAGGAVKGALLTTVSGSGQALTGANAVGGFDATNRNSGGVLLNNTAALLTVTGITNNAANGSVTVTQTGALTTAGAVRTAAGGAGAVALTSAGAGHSTTVNGVVASGSGQISIDSAGAITQGAGGAFSTSGLLQTTSALGQTLVGANTVGSFNASNSGGGDIVLRNTALLLTLTGVTNAAASGGVSVSNTGAINTSGAVGTAADGPIGLQANDGSLTVGQVVAAGGAGTVSLTSTGVGSAITLNATVGSGSGTVSANSAGAITQGANGKVSTSGLLQTTSALGQTLVGANTVGSFNAVNSSRGDIVLTNTTAPPAATLTLTGIDNRAVNGGVAVTQAGALSTGGAVRSAGAGLIVLTTSQDLVLGGDVDAGRGGVVLSAPAGTITQGAGGTLTASGLGVQATAAPVLARSNLGTVAADITGAGNPFAYSQAGAFDIGTVGLVSGVRTRDAAVTLTASAGDLTMSQPVDAGTGALNLSAPLGSITQAGSGIVKGALLTTVSGAGQALSGANAVGGFNATNSNSGGVLLNNTAALLTVTGITNNAANGSATVTHTGALTTSGAIRTAVGGAGPVALTSAGAGNSTTIDGVVASGSGQISVDSAGAITQGAGGAFSTSGLLQTTSALGQTLTGVNAVGSFNARNSGGGDIVLSNTAPLLALTGITNAAANGGVSVSNTGAINTSGAVGTAADGPIGLQANDGSLTVGQAVAAGGAGTVSLTSAGVGSAITLNATVGSGSGTVSANSAGAITQGANGKVSTSGLLQATSALGQTLSGANTVGSFNAFNSSRGDIVLNNTAALLTVTGITNDAANGSATVTHTGALTTSGAIRTAAGGAIGLQANNGALTLRQSVTASGAGTVTLKTTGAGRAISQDANGVLTTGTLSLYAVDADATLNQAPNRVARVQGVDLGRGALALKADAAVLTAADITAQGGLEITNLSGNITTTGDLNVGAGNLTLDATAAGKTVHLGGALTASNDLVLRADAALDTGAGQVRATNGRATLSSRSAGVAVGAGGVYAATTVALVAGGAGSAITQRAGGAITAESLTLSTQDGDANLDAAASALTRLGTVALGRGALSLLNAGPLTVTGPVAATGGIRLDTGGALSLAGPLDAAAGAVALSTRGGSAGTITQGAAGGITTASLSLKTVDAGVSLDTAPNAVAGLGPTALGTGALSLRSAGSLTVTGAVAAGGGVTLNTGGALVLNDTVDAGTGTVALRTGGGAGSTVGQSARGRITAASLSLATAGADVSLDTAANAVPQLTTTALGAGALKLRTAGGLTVTGAVAATGGVGLTAGGPLALNNNVDAGTGVAALATQGPGHAITQNAAGRVSADTLTLATEGGDATLNTAPHALRQLGAAGLGSGRLSLLDAGGLTVAGPVVAGGVSLNTGGGLKVDGLVNVGAGRVALTATGAGNDITQAPAGRIVVGVLVLDGGNIALGQVELGVVAAAGRVGPGLLALQTTAEDSAAITVKNAGVTLGATNIGTRAQNGNFTLSVAGNINQSAPLKVSGDSRFAANLPDTSARETLDVLLTGANLFGGSVSVTGSNLENVSLSAPTLQIGESAGVNVLFPQLTGAGIVGRNVSLKTDLLTSLLTSRDDVKGSIVVRDQGVLNLLAFTDGKEGSFGTPARPVKVQFLTPLGLSQDTVNVLPAVGSVVYLVGPVAPAPFYSRGLRSVCYNFLGDRCQRLSAPITQTALNAAYSELRRLIEEVLRSGYSKENVQSELIKGLVIESGMAPPALDDIAGDGIRLPR